ncbi:hypothetical protein [Providencia rettgeri]|uniref:hypothetical protein n=1 Tax=Providencia rettgeri TaxID=587 RepID=UPI00165773C6|nr:hypothetical protein H9L31_04155 [Providencia rettgeri]
MRSPWNDFWNILLLEMVLAGLVQPDCSVLPELLWQIISIVEAYAESVCVQVPHGVCASILISTDNSCELANQPWHSPQ